MATPNLVLNILTFEYPFEEKSFAVYDTEAPGLCRFHRKKLPESINDLFPLNEQQDNIFLYLDLSKESKTAQFLTIKFKENPSFAKHYYTWLIQRYFKNVADITHSNFVKDIDLWFYDKAQSTDLIKCYTGYCVRVQIARNSDKPELVISYSGTKAVHKQSVLALDIDTTKYKWVVYKNELYRYKYLPDEAKSEWAKVFPVLSNELKTELDVVIKRPRTNNKYKPYYDKLKSFVENHLNKESFKELIPLSSTDFLKVPDSMINNTSHGSNLLEFGKKRKNRVPFDGLVANGPFGHSPHEHIQIFFIGHTSHKEEVNILFGHLKKGMGKVPSLNMLVNKPLNINSTTSIKFTNLLNPLPEIMQVVESRKYDPNTNYLAIYISPYDKNEDDPALRNIYYKLKQSLLKYRISSQVVFANKIKDQYFNIYYVNICIAILAKLGGVPWRLERDDHNELVVGVGAFKSISSGIRYIGGAFCFSNDGRFHNFECFSESDYHMLVGPISKAINNFRDKFKDVKRLVIHYYKRISEEELKPITKLLYNIKLDIPVIIISINKTESSDYVIFDTNCPAIIPVSGTFISIGYDQYLLCNNTRYSDSLPKDNDGFPFPIKLTIKSAHKEHIITEQDKSQLIDQVYQFSRMYWKSVRQQNLPVTIKYPEMVASFVPFFPNQTIPDYGKDNLWFL